MKERKRYAEDKGFTISFNFNTYHIFNLKLEWLTAADAFGSLSTMPLLSAPFVGLLGELCQN